MRWSSKLRLLYRNRSVFFGSLLLCSVLLMTLIGPFFAEDPNTLHHYARLQTPSAGYWLGSDWLGRDVFARVVYGGRVSLSIGVLVTLVSLSIGLTLGLIAGYTRYAGVIIMRAMDGLMAIPGVLLAIWLVSILGATVQSVVIAITIADIPRVVRVVRSVVLTVREEPYVEAAIIAGTSKVLILIRHILPNTIGPLLVQGSFICGSAMIVEAALGFLGAGVSSETPSWGNVMGEGRSYFQLAPWVIFMPGLVLSITVLSVNLIGDGLRDTLDPRIARNLRDTYE